MDGIAISTDTTQGYLPAFVGQRDRLQVALAAPRRCLLPGAGRIVHAKRKRLYPIPMTMDMLCYMMLRPKRRCKDKSQFLLTHDIAHGLAVTRLGAAIRDGLKSKGSLVVVGSLFRIADIKLHKIGPL